MTDLAHLSATRLPQPSPPGAPGDPDPESPPLQARPVPSLDVGDVGEAADAGAVGVVGEAAEAAPGTTTDRVSPGHGVLRNDSAEGFDPGVAAKLRSYVYLLVDPRTGRPFSVGSGRGDRCFHHLRAARAGVESDPGDSMGSPARYAALDRIRSLESSGRTVRIDILRHGLEVEEAMLVEAATADALGLPNGSKLASQRAPSAEVASQLAKRAKFKRSHQVVLLRVGPTGTETDYELVRHGWRIGQRWTDLDSPRSPRWAVVVVGELVASVYRIEGWGVTERGAHSPTPPPGSQALVDRYSFTGAQDPELEARYRGRNVTQYLGAGGQNPVSYVWCGPHWVNSPG